MSVVLLTEKVAETVFPEEEVATKVLPFNDQVPVLPNDDEDEE